MRVRRQGNAVIAATVLLLGACDGSRRSGGGGEPNGSLVDGAVGQKGQDPFPNLPTDAGIPSRSDGSTSGDANNLDGGIGDSGAAQSDGGVSSLDASAPVQLRGCFPACVTAADCSTGSTALFDSEHYECLNGGCRWMGCFETFECTEAYQSSNYSCSAQNGMSIPSCVQTCLTVDDCPVSTASVYDRDNWACSGSLCQWTGCNSTDECVTDQGANHVCETVSGSTTPICVKTCSSSADCAQANPLLDQDNYRCESNRCVWTGCNDAVECQQGTSSPFVCDEI